MEQDRSTQAETVGQLAIGWTPAGRWFCSIHSTVCDQSRPPLQLTTVQQHLAKTEVVRNCGDQPAAAKGLRVGWVMGPPFCGSTIFNPPSSPGP